MNIKKPFCSILNCIHCSNSSITKIYGTAYKRCDLPIVKKLTFINRPCPKYKGEIRHGKFTVLCSKLNCKYILKNSPNENGYKKCTILHSVIQGQKQGCNKYKEE